MRPALLALTLAEPAGGSPVDLEWHGDATCPSDQLFKQDLASHLRSGEATTAVHARVDVRQVDAAWALELTLTAADGASTRQLTGASCADVSAAAAFITALVVDPGLLSREPQPAPPPDPVPPPAPAPTKPDPPPTLKKPRLRGFLRLAGGLEALGMPGVGPIIKTAGGVFGWRWRLEVTGLYRAPSRAAADDAPGVTGVLRLWTLGLRGCGVLRPGPLELPLCLGAEAGQAIGDAEGSLVRSQRARLPWLAAVVAPALAWSPRPRFAVWIGLELAVPLLPGKFTVAVGGEPRTVHSYAPVSLRTGLGVEVRFP